MWPTGVYKVVTWNTSTKPLLIWDKYHVAHGCLQSSHMEHINKATTDLGQIPRGPRGYIKWSSGKKNRICLEIKWKYFFILIIIYTFYYSCDTVNLHVGFQTFFQTF